MAVATLRDEVTELLQELIRLNTVNPPGNETAAAELLRDYLEANGVECELYARVPERANLVARIPGRGDGPTLALLSHTDTVLADAAEWSRDPWSGELRDGEVWGRGALDMKGQVAASAVAIASLAREGFEPRGDLIFVATADEEVGDGFGARVALREHPDAVRATTRSTRAAASGVELGGRPFYLCSTAEKMSAPFVLRVRGRSGHASMPGIADNALVKAAPLIERSARSRPSRSSRPRPRRSSSAVIGERAAAPRRRSSARGESTRCGEMVEPLLSLTLSPTMIEASKKRNVIPGVCEVTVDWRLLPGQTPEEPRRSCARCSATATTSSSGSRRTGGTRSPLETPLWDAIDGVGRGNEPGRRARRRSASPASPTATGCARRSARSRTGSSRCGRWSAELAARLIHSADERIPVDDLELGVDFSARRPRRQSWRSYPRADGREDPPRRDGAPNGVLVHGPTSWALRDPARRTAS